MKKFGAAGDLCELCKWPTQL